MPAYMPAHHGFVHGRRLDPNDLRLLLAALPAQLAPVEGGYGLVGLDRLACMPQLPLAHLEVGVQLPDADAGGLDILVQVAPGGCAAGVRSGVRSGVRPRGLRGSGVGGNG